MRVSDAAAKGTPAVSDKPIIGLLACGGAGNGASTLIAHFVSGSKPGASGEGAGRFATDKRSFVVADIPGQEHATRSLATAASRSELAVIVVDAGKGVLSETRRQAYIVSALGIRHVVLAVNKLDLVEFSQAVFERIASEFREFAARLAFAEIVAIPVSALHGDNVVVRSGRTPWYKGPALLEHLETVEVDRALASKPFRMPVQRVDRSDPESPRLSGTIVSGTIRRGDEIVVAKSGRLSRVKRIVSANGDLDADSAGQAVTIVLADEVDVARGDVLVAPDKRPEVADQFAAHILWMADEDMLPHRQYLIEAGGQSVLGQVTTLKHKVDTTTLEHIASRTLKLDEIGYGNLSTSDVIAFDAHRDNRAMGGFVIIDRFTNATVGVGMIEFGLRRATNVHWQALDVDWQSRAGLKGQMPCVLWFTGLSGSGKSTIANLVEKRLFGEGRHTYLLDGDNVRHGLNQDLGFTDADRVENIRRVAEAAKLFVDAGLITLVSFISPFRSERRIARDLLRPGQFVEIFVDTPIELCMARDPKGLYKRAVAGQIKNFTGIDSPYERPENPELTLETATLSAEDAAERIVAYLKVRGIVPDG